MSTQHPIIAVTGSSGAGTSDIKTAFEQIFEREGIAPALIEGDCFHRYDRVRMDEEVTKARRRGGNLTHFGPEGNLFGELEAVFAEYAERGSGRRRYYIHNEQEADRHGFPPGSLTPWESLPADTDLLFYEGLHGGLVTDSADVCRYVDLLIGVVPIINLEWIQKIQRDKAVRGYTAEDATKMILDRMHDYVHYITPQFSRTDLNFQRVPTVDTSNPFAAESIPGDDQSFTVIHVRNQRKVQIDLDQLLERLEGAFLSAPGTLVVPGRIRILALQLIITPVVTSLIRARDEARQHRGSNT